MELGVHLPQVTFDGSVPSGARVLEIAALAADLGFAAVAANDHLAWRRAWLDGLTALAAVASSTGSLQLVTTVALPTVRGPAQLAAALAGLDAFAPGRVVAGLGPGSSSVDHALAGLPFEGRWAAFDEAVAVLRGLLHAGQLPPGWAERLDDQVPAAAVATARVPLWVASWGSPAGLRRVARLGDGWLASAYRTTPDAFATAGVALDAELARRGRPSVPRALATLWTHVTDDEVDADRVLGTVLAPLLGASPDALRGRLCVGSARRCADLLARYAAAGCARVYLWPVGDEAVQLRRVVAEVVPLLGEAITRPAARPA